MSFLDFLGNNLLSDAGQASGLELQKQKIALQNLLSQQAAQAQLGLVPDPTTGQMYGAPSPPQNIAAAPGGYSQGAIVPSGDTTQGGSLLSGMPALQIAPSTTPLPAINQRNAQVTVPGQIGQNLLSADEYQPAATNLLRQADPQAFLNADITRATLGPLLRNTGMNDSQIAAYLLDPKSAGEANAKAAFPEATPQQKVAQALANMDPNDPRRAPLQAWLDKQGYIPEKDPLHVAQVNADIAEKGAQTTLANTRNNLMTSSGLDDDTMERVYQQVKAGQNLNQVIPNLGRGQQGAQQIMELQNYISKRLKADAVNPSDLAAAQVNLKAQTAAASQAAKRGANVDMGAIELGTFGDQALDALSKIDNSKFVPWNTLSNLAASQISDPNLAAYQTALQGVRGAYASVISRGGVPSVDAQHKADILLNTATGPEAVKAIIAQMKREASGVQSSSQTVQKGIVGNVTGQGAGPQVVAPVAQPVPNPATSVPIPPGTPFARDANGNVVHFINGKWQ